MLIDYRPPLEPYLDILYQDNDILLLNKPSGLLTVPGKAPEHKDSLLYRVSLVWPQARIVHRLDMATSGLIVMALTAEAQRRLNKQFSLRQVQKEYIARVSGHLSARQGCIDLPLICDWPNRPKQKVCFEYGKPSVTHYQVLQYETHATRISLTPLTGRSHQLRVHMQWLGHPILGDKFYADITGRKQAARLQLHAQNLTFIHPVTEKQLVFCVNCPF